MKKCFWRRFERLLDRYFEKKKARKISQFKRCGSNFYLHEPCFFAGSEYIEIGDDVVINAFTHIWGHGGVIIGNNVLIASHTAITSLTHNPNSKVFSDENIAKPIKIGNNVWIGAHAVIMPGIQIGNNCIIGAGAIVNKNIPDGTVYAGVPAKELYQLPQFNSLSNASDTTSTHPEGNSL